PTRFPYTALFRSPRRVPASACSCRRATSTRPSGRSSTSSGSSSTKRVRSAAFCRSSTSSGSRRPAAWASVRTSRTASRSASPARSRRGAGVAGTSPALAESGRSSSGRGSLMRPHYRDPRTERDNGGMAQPLTRADGAPPRILVVDDESTLAALLAMAFSCQSWEPRIAGTVQDALAAAREAHFDEAVLDIMLPDGDGVDLMARLRRRDDDLPVLFRTAKDAIDDRVTGLRAGGDDYVTKPFNLDEVVARVEALLRRTLGTSGGEDRVLTVGDLTVDLGAREVSRAG